MREIEYITNFMKLSFLFFRPLRIMWLMKTLKRAACILPWEW